MGKINGTADKRQTGIILIRIQRQKRKYWKIFSIEKFKREW
jgi:hypothetical protein